MAKDMVGYTIQKTRGGSVLWRDGYPPHVSYIVKRGVRRYRSRFLRRMVQLPCDALKWAGTLKEDPLKQIEVEYGSNVARGIDYLVRIATRNDSERIDTLRSVAQLPDKATSLAKLLDPSIEAPEFMFPREVGLDPCVHPLTFYWKVVKKIRDCTKEGSFYLGGDALVLVGKRAFNSDSINEGYSIDERLLIGRINNPDGKNELLLYAQILQEKR